MDGSLKPLAASDWTALLAGRDESPLWIELLRRRASAGDRVARKIIDLLGALPHALAASAEGALGAVQDLSSCVLDFVNDQDQPDIDVVQATLFWTNRINCALDAAKRSMRLRKIYPRDRFDHDTMESVASETGYNLTVARALTWTIFDPGDPRNRVLHRGKVVTS